MSQARIPTEALTLDEYAERMKGRTRPLTQDPVQLRRATTDHQISRARMAGVDRLRSERAEALGIRRADAAATPSGDAT